MSQGECAVYEYAKQRYAAVGVDAEKAIEKALSTPISLHCWQADDIRGFECFGSDSTLDSGGIMATGSYIGLPRTPDELRQDVAAAIALIPGTQRVNLHASYAEPTTTATTEEEKQKKKDKRTHLNVERDELTVENFSSWLKWAEKLGLKLDFNPTFFAHPKAASGFTLSHQSDDIRAYWIRHGVACRRVAAALALQQRSPCAVNWWVPDGSKDLRVDRQGPRKRLAAAYDEIFDKKHGIDPAKCVDFLEGKLFGLGSEEYTVGSHEFYTGYAVSRNVGLCLDMGHFHPTETIHDKIVSHLQFVPSLLLHVSRPIRWDSDHVVVFNDDVRAVFAEVHRCGAWDKVRVALDYFDASINRIAAYVIGARATRMAMLYALLEPTAQLQAYEREGDFTRRLALLEATKALPHTLVWDELCRRAGVPVGDEWAASVRRYEDTELRHRKKRKLDQIS